MTDQSRFSVRVYWRYADRSGTYTDTSRTGWYDDNGEPCFWMWEEGNYSCDCNRALLFGLGDDWQCGDKIVVYNIQVIGE